MRHDAQNGCRSRSGRGGAWRWGQRLVAVLMGGVLLGAGCTVPPPERRVDPEADRTYRGKEIGRQFIAKSVRQYEFHTDEDITGLVNEVGAKVVQVSGADPAEFHFFVVKNPQANAFAIPGGYVFLFDGLIKRLSGEEALAGVLAHEVAHVRHDHFFKDQKKMHAADIAILAAVLLGQGSEAVAAFSLAGAATLQLAYSRANEREADVAALEYLARAGYPPGGLALFFDTLIERERLVVPKGNFAYLSTHPGLEDRYDRVVRLAARSSAGGAGKLDPDRWDRLQAALAVDGPAGLVDPGGRFRQGLIAMHKSRYAEALPLLEEEARARPDAGEVQEALAACLLAMRRTDEAERHVVRALRITPDGARPLYLKGEVERLRGNHPAALKIYQEAIRHHPDHAMSHFRLSQMLEKMGDVDSARFHLARYLRLSIKPYEAAAVLTELKRGGDPRLMEQVEAELNSLTEHGV